MASATWEPISPSAGSQEEDLLLREALAIIGDLDGDVDPLIDSFSHDSTEQSQPVVGLHSCSFVDSLPPTRSAGQVDSPASLQHAKWPTASSSRALHGSGRQPKRRRRQELLYLRGLVAELEDRLNGLRKPTEEQGTDCQESEARDASTELATALWANVATHQRTQRQESEMENAKLRQLLQDQIQLGKSLERLLLRKRPKLEAGEFTAPHAARYHRSRSQSWNRAQIFEELVVACAHLYAVAARVLGHFDLGVQAPVPRKVELVHDQEDGLTVQTTERRVVPFHFEETASEMWQVFPHASATIQGVDQRSGDLSEMQFRFVPRIDHSAGEFSVKLVKRRYVEAQRVVIVYSAHIEPSSASATNLDGISIRHKAWHIIEPLQTCPRRGSMITVYHASVPESANFAPDQEREVGTLTNFLLTAISTELETHHQNLENRLIERSLYNSQKIK